MVVNSKRAFLWMSFGWACLVAAAGCEASGGDATTDSPPAPQDAAADIADAAMAAPTIPRDPRCVAPEGVSTAPQSIAEVVTLLNALPKPVTVPCFVASLARPLSLHAVNSPFSAQPAQGRKSPRIFIFFPGLILSIVPAGPGAHLLEFGETRPDAQSLKAELEFPITGQLDEASPYQRVFFSETITTCGFCHQNERRDESIGSPLAMISPALRPRPEQRVLLDELAAQVAACDATAMAGAPATPMLPPADAGADAGINEAERCAMLHAIFDQLPAPIEAEFPETYKIFF